MTKKILSAICAFALMIGLVFTGCGDKTPTTTAPITNEATEPAFHIPVKANIPMASVGDNYDLMDLVEEDKDISYSFTASYIDPETGATEELIVKREKVKPKTEADISVTILAEKNKETASVTVTIPIYKTYDVLDHYLQTGGVAGESSQGVEKTIVKDKAYLQSENSVSSLKVMFQNPAAANEGANLLTLSHYSVVPYFSANVMHNAAVTFWVYNPMDKQVAFKLTSYNPETFKTLLWDSADNTQIQYALPGQWTQIVFSLYQMDITKLLYSSLDGLREDSLKVVARYEGTDACNIYIDNIDVVDAASLGLSTGYQKPEPPAGDFTDLLSTCNVYTEDPVAKLTKSTNGNGTNTAYCFGADKKCGYPTFYIMFPEVTDISGFDYLSFDMYAEKCYPWVSAGILYLDENGEVQKHATSFDTYREQWRTIYLNLDYLKYADQTQAVGICISIFVENHFVENFFNCVYFDNMKLYTLDAAEPTIQPATMEDNDLLNNPFFSANIKPNTSGISKVATDETGIAKSNSTLLFWTNNACGYPNVFAHFVFEREQDWTSKSMLTFDTHQYNGHYWMGFNIITLDENGNQKTYFWRHDTVLTNWLTTSAPFEWFKDQDGNTMKPEDLKRVVGLTISVDLAVNITDEVAHIFFDNLYVV